MTFHYRACHLCEAICGVAVEHDGGEIRSIRGDSDDPLSRGHICPKALALKDIHEDPDRLRHPVRRTPGGWQRLSWKAALDEVGTRLQETRKRHGRDAVGVYLGNPTVHNYGTVMFLPGLLKALGTRNRFSATSLDQLPHLLASALMFGHPLLFPVPDVDRTDYFVIMGGNPAVSNGSLMTAPDIKNRLRAVRARGGQVVVIDPRRTETADLAGRHLFIRPGTDALLLLAVLHTLREEGLARPGPFVNGLEVFWRAVVGVTPEAVAPVTGITPDDIRRLAREFAAARSAVWYGRFGVCTQEFGGLAMWLIYAINVVTGNLDREGGAMFPRPAVDLIALDPAPFTGFGRWHSRVRHLPEFYGELPAATMAEEMLTPGEGQIRAMLTVAGNPVLSSPNGKQLERALAGLDFMAAIDIYVNETTRHANIILPPTFGLEHENYDLVFHLLAIRNTARYSPALLAPGGNTRHDWEILLGLTTRLLSRGPWSRLWARLRQAALGWVGPERLLDLALRRGPQKLTLGRLRRSPHGVDLGPLTPCLPGRLRTASKRIELAPDGYLVDIGRLRASLLRPAPALVLIGRRDLRSNNSWMHNSARLMRGGARCSLLMNPADGRRLGIADGQRVRVASRVGSVEVEAELSDEVMHGVVSLPHGWGHDREGVLLRTASRHPGASANDLTDEAAVDTLSGNAVLNGVPVVVLPAGG
ncbi:MAG: molybdopterin oxidoreductase family protein [Gemmataceae bacterium]